MKKLLSVAYLIIIYQVTYSQTNASKIVLGIPSLARAQQANNSNYANTAAQQVGDVVVSNQLTDATATELSNVVQEEAGKVRDLVVVPRNSDATQKIDSELSSQTSISKINSDVLAEAGKQLGATYFLIGKITKIDLTKKHIKDKIVFGVPIPVYAKLVNIQVYISIINVSTGQADASVNLSSDDEPIAEFTESRTIDKGIKNMGPKFLSFIQNWYSGKTGINNTKAN